MKLSSVVAENVKKIAVLNLILTAIENVVFRMLSAWNAGVLWGSLLGYILSVVNFLWLGVSVQNAVEREQKQAQIYMQSTYMARTVMVAAVFAISIISPVFNWIAVLPPVFFTRISIIIINFISKEE